MAWSYEYEPQSACAFGMSLSVLPAAAAFEQPFIQMTLGQTFSERARPSPEGDCLIAYGLFRS